MSRFDYVKYDENSVIAQDNLKATFEALEVLVTRETTPGRAQALIFTKLEEAYMWCGKAIRDDQIKRNGSAELQAERIGRAARGKERRMRKVVQIAVANSSVGGTYYSTLIVLCDDGVVLEYAPSEPSRWRKFPGVPSDEADLRVVVPFSSDNSSQRKPFER